MIYIPIVFCPLTVRRNRMRSNRGRMNGWKKEYRRINVEQNNEEKKMRMKIEEKREENGWKKEENQ